MTALREVNAERAMHLRRALEEIAYAAGLDHTPLLARDALDIALDALADDDIAIELAEQAAADCDPEPS